MLRLAPALTIALLIGPVAAGLIGTLLPAFGYLPALGGTSVSLAAFQALFETPGIWVSLRLSLATGFCASVGALAIVVFFTAAFEGTGLFRLMQRLLSPILAIPHAAAAFGFAFLIAPSGWIFRLLSPWATGFDRPPDLLIIHDTAGIAMTLGLMAKEVPFLFLMVLAALPQTESVRSRHIAASFGYRPVAAWLKTVLPRLYPQIRLPFFAVIAYATSVVDVALILGPTTPAPLAVRLTGWMNDPDLQLRFVAAAGALLQLAASLAAIAFCILIEHLAAGLGRRWLEAGGRGFADKPAAALSGATMAGIAATLGFGLLTIALWSVAGRWTFPNGLPSQLTLDVWAANISGAAAAITTTALTGGTVALVAVTLALACLEGESRRKRKVEHRRLFLLYLPLLVPQVAFLFGLQVLFLSVGLDATVSGVAIAHLTFVLPYVFLALSDPWHAVDPRYADIAASLGAPPARIFWRIRLPIALRAIATAAALGFAVSVAQYLPTLLIGAGRVETVTTEAVALASGGNRPLIGVYATLQMVLPFMGFLAAGLITSLTFRNRRALKATH